MRHFIFVLLLLSGLAAGYFTSSLEQKMVESYLIGFPQADPKLHCWRPFAMWGLCLVPALGALCYNMMGILDRFLFRQVLITTSIATAFLVLVFVLFDLQEVLSEFTTTDSPLTFIPTYYAVLISQVLVLLLPFTTLFGFLAALGKLSTDREIIGLTQTGRGLMRVLTPAITLGYLISLVSFFLNIHLAPWSEGYRKALLRSAESGVTAQASNVMHHDAKSGRLWYIRNIPYDLRGKEPLTGISISLPDEKGDLMARLHSPKAVWDRETNYWHFHQPTLLATQAQPTPRYLENLKDPLVITDWTETPPQLVQDGLDPRYLGIPSLLDWLRGGDKDLFDARIFSSQFHSRIAKPWLCLISALLAAPLGITFSRRTRKGTFVLALVLCLLMIFFDKVFLAFAEAGQLPAILGAWSSNLIFLLLAFILIDRRLRGRPIFQSLSRLFPS